MFRSLLISSLLLGVSSLLSGNSIAQTYPTRTITAVVPFAAGSSNDTVGRIIAPRLAKALGQSVVIQNKPGADGLIGIQQVAEAAPDGYTILFSAGAVVLAPALHKKVGYDPEKNIMGIASLGISPYIIAASAKLNIKTVPELMAYLKANPGKLNVPTSGNSSRAFAELFKQVTQTDFTIVNFNGTGGAATSLLSGETDFALLDSASFGMATADRIKLLAVAGNQRIASRPELPTSVEAGLPGYQASAFFGVFMPGGVPDAIADKLNSEINKILLSEEVKVEFERLGITPSATDRKAFDLRYHEELKTWKDVVQKAGIPLAD